MWYVKYLMWLMQIIMIPYNWLMSLFKHQNTFATKIIGTGCYRPLKHMCNKEIVNELNKNELQEKYQREIDKGRIPQNSKMDIVDFIKYHYGLSGRYRANSTETNSFMGAEACKGAMRAANITKDDIDLLIYAAASMDEIIPDTSAKVHKLLGLEGIPSFTVHSTCISFMHAMNAANAFIESGTYRTIMIVSPEKLTSTTNANDTKTHVIMGDIAAAVILQRAPIDSESKVVSTKFATFGEFSDQIKCNIGNIMHPCTGKYSKEDFYFQTESVSLVQQVPLLVRQFLSNLTMNYSHVVIHQPSKIALSHAFQVFDKKMVTETFDTIGNCAGATIPYNLHMLVTSGELKRGENILIVGLGAGLGVGCINVCY